MSAVAITIEEVLKTPSKQYTREEAQQILRQCGVLDKNNRVKSAYKDILIQKQDAEDGCESV